MHPPIIMARAWTLAPFQGSEAQATVQEHLDFLPSDERTLTAHPRELLNQQAPELQERISFNVPFYKVRKYICFLWPASVLWGERKTCEASRHFPSSFSSTCTPIPSPASHPLRQE